MTNIVQNLTMWCAYDSNPGLQDGRRGRIHRAMAATPFEITICRCHFNPLFFPIFLNWPSFSFIFVFSNKHDNSYNKYMCKMLCPSSMQRRDSNPRLLEPESPPITSRPGLPPPSALFVLIVAVELKSRLIDLLLMSLFLRFPTAADIRQIKR